MALNSILLSVPSLAVTDGGPPVVVSELSLALADAGISVHILTGSAGHEPECLPRHSKVVIHRVPTSCGRGVSAWFASLLQGKSPPQVVHDFGLWRPIHHRVARAAHAFSLPYINSPSGMLARRALAQKCWKKQIAWALYQSSDLSRAALLVASSTTEAQQLRRLLPNTPVAVVPHGVRLPPSPASPQASDNARPHPSRTVLFLGRLDPIKGLAGWIEAWSRVRPQGWSCVLAGPGPIAYESHLRELTRKTGCAPDFHFHGPVDSHHKWELLRSADLLVLPSESENFGLVVAEALAVGVPVITTRATPWLELESVGCGWVVPTSIPHLVDALRQATSITDGERRRMGDLGRAWVSRQYTWPGAAERMRWLCAWILRASPIPESLRCPDMPQASTDLGKLSAPEVRWTHLFGFPWAADPDSRP